MHRRLACLVTIAVLCTGVLSAAALDETTVVHRQRTVSLYVPAVAELEDGGLRGVLSVLTLTAQQPGRGDVFLRTEPLAEVDMLGAARLAVTAAGEITGRGVDEWDYFYTVTTSSPVIGGPSGGAAMATAATAILMNWSLDPDVAMTGMVNPDLTVGPVGGIYHKAEALASIGIQEFLVPAGQSVQLTTFRETDEDGVTQTYTEVVDVAAHAREHWDLAITEVEDLYDVIPTMAGFTLQRPTTNVDPSHAAAYRQLMQGLSSTQRTQASDQHDRAQAALTANASRFSAADQRAMQGALNTSAARITDAENAAAASKYYQSSSFSFQSLVQTRFVLAFTSFDADASDFPSYVQAYLENSRTLREDADGARVNPFPWTPNELGAQAAVELRLNEASELLDAAQAQWAAGNHGSALERSGYARERLQSAQWWSTIRDRVEALSNVEAEITRAQVEALSQSMASTSTLLDTYATRLLSQIQPGSTHPLLAQASQSISRGRAAMDSDQVAMALFSYVEAASQVTAAIASLNPEEVLRSQLESLRERAAFEIALARGFGVEPIFASSQFEFAEYLETLGAQDAYEAYTFARMAARATLQAAGYQPPPAGFAPVPGRGASAFAEALYGGAWTWAVFVAMPGVWALALAGVAMYASREKTS